MMKRKIKVSDYYAISEIVEGGFYVKIPDLNRKFKVGKVRGREFGKLILNLLTNSEEEVIFESGDLVKVCVENIDPKDYETYLKKLKEEKDDEEKEE